MKILAKFALVSCLAATLVPATLHAASADDGGKKAKKEKKEGGKKEGGKKKSKGKKSEPGEPEKQPADPGAKGVIVPADELPAAPDGNWCDWLRDEPGLLYENKDNLWIQSFQIGGRFNYQAAYLEGTDVNGVDFNDHYDEYRRLRFETKTEFLRFFTAEINVNLVDDNRFREGPFNELEWGYDNFDEASLEFNIGEAFGKGGLDGIKLKAGRMKLKMTEEVHMSSNEIYTLERSGIADKLGGLASRPTGVTLELDKGDWELVVGMFSGEDDADFIGGWNDGQFYYGSVQWKPSKDFKMILDYTQNDASGADDALGYGWATALSAVYEKDSWGILGEAICGDNGGGVSAPITRRQGDFHGFVVMPWYWIIEDKLQAVVQYQYASATETQGLQLPSRYVRGDHENLAVDVDNGRGSEHHMIYAGLNYHFCKDRLKIMGGVSYDDLSTRLSDLDALTYQIGFRAAF
jgi:hypothetical protein